MEILKTLRDRAGLTLRQVEQMTGISNSYLSQLETGKINRPSAQALYILAKLYNYGIEDLLVESGLVKEVIIQPVELKPSIETRLEEIESRVKRLEAAGFMNRPLM